MEVFRSQSQIEFIHWDTSYFFLREDTKNENKNGRETVPSLLLLFFSCAAPINKNGDVEAEATPASASAPAKGNSGAALSDDVTPLDRRNERERSWLEQIFHIFSFQGT